jgi:hypothetical protein
MKISELFEAIGTIGTTTDKVEPNGLPKTGAPMAPQSPGNAPKASMAPLSPPAGQPTQQSQPSQGTTFTPQGNSPMGQQQANPEIQQTMNSTMRDIDQIAVQIAGLKQRQRQMQQQMQTPTV